MKNKGKIIRAKIQNGTHTVTPLCKLVPYTGSYILHMHALNVQQTTAHKEHTSFNCLFP